MSFDVNPRDDEPRDETENESASDTILRLRWDFVNAAKLNHNHGGHVREWGDCGSDVCQRAYIEEQIIAKGTRP